MSKNEFNNGDLVRITYDFKRPNRDGGYDYFVEVFDRSGDKYVICTNDDRIYEVNVTKAMPILTKGGYTFYPLRDFHRPHLAKFFIDGRFLESANDEWPEDDEDDEPYIHEPDVVYADDDEEEVNEDANASEEDNVDPDPEGKADWEETQEFAKISRNISIITEALAEVTESLTAILKNRMAR